MVVELSYLGTHIGQVKEIIGGIPYFANSQAWVMYAKRRGTMPSIMPKRGIPELLVQLSYLRTGNTLRS